MHHENEDQLIQHLGAIADNLKEIDRGMPSLDCDFPTLYEVELYLSQISNYTGCVNDRLIETVKVLKELKDDFWDVGTGMSVAEAMSCIEGQLDSVRQELGLLCLFQFAKFDQPGADDLIAKQWKRFRKHMETDLEAQ